MLLRLLHGHADERGVRVRRLDVRVRLVVHGVRPDQRRPAQGRAVRQGHPGFHPRGLGGHHAPHHAQLGLQELRRRGGPALDELVRVVAAAGRGRARRRRRRGDLEDVEVLQPAEAGEGVVEGDAAVAAGVVGVPRQPVLLQAVRQLRGARVGGGRGGDAGDARGGGGGGGVDGGGGARGAQHDGHLHAAGALSHHALSPAHSMQRTGSASRPGKG